MLTGVVCNGRLLIKTEPKPYSYSLNKDAIDASVFIYNGHELCSFIIDTLKEGLTND